MQTFPLTDPESGVTYAFEIEMAYISPKRIAKLLAESPYTSNVKCRRLFGPDAETHVTFTYNGSNYIVWEPYGDNSRYWIGPKDEMERSVDITPIEDVFRIYKPPLIRRIIGNVLTLRFLSNSKDRQSSS